MKAMPRRKLIDTGKMPAQNLHVYQDMGAAINDLKAGRIEAVWLGLLPAQDFAKDGTVKIAAQNLNQQLYGIAVKQGATTLRHKINDALTTLQNNGTIARLAQEYLKVPAERDREAARAADTGAARRNPAAAGLCGWRRLGGRSLV